MLARNFSSPGERREGEPAVPAEAAAAGGLTAGAQAAAAPRRKRPSRSRRTLKASPATREKPVAYRAGTTTAPWITISTRRFRGLPPAGAFGATRRLLPYPPLAIRAGAPPPA